MCTAPISIRNPYYDRPALEYRKGSVAQLDRRFVSHREYIDVPCGKCADCRASQFLAIQQRAQCEALTSYVYFVTLTYNDEHIPSVQFRADDGSEQPLYFSDIQHIQSMIKRLRNIELFQQRDLRYLGVTEYGSARFRPHHHLLIFVAKLPDDDYTVSVSIEKILKDNVLKYYAINKGTRKQPVYEQLLTPLRVRTRDGRYKSTYDVRLVRDKSMDKSDPKSICSVESIAKSVSYLMSYINKPSVFDFSIAEAMEQMQLILDPVLYRRLRSIVKTRVYYSKHFGFGFENGHKVSPSVRSKSMTEESYQIATFLRDEIPESIEELAHQRPELYDFYVENSSRILEEYIPSYMSNHYKTCKNLTKFYYECVPSSIILRMAKKLEPRFVSAFLHQLDTYTKDVDIPWIPRDYDSSFESSATYKYIRKGVEAGLRTKQKYLAFHFQSKGRVNYAPLCKYYRRYCTDYDDVRRLYDSIGVRNFDEYIDSIVPDIELTLKRKRAQKTAFEKQESKRIVENCAIFTHKHNDLSKIMHIFVPVVSEINSLYHANKSVYQARNAE